MPPAERRTVRAGGTRPLPAEELVPGDVVLLESGDKIPADLRLVDVKNRRTEEATLTVESVPIDKTTEAVSEKSTVGYPTRMAFSCTLLPPSTHSALATSPPHYTPTPRHHSPTT